MLETLSIRIQNWIFISVYLPKYSKKYRVTERQDDALMLRLWKSLLWTTVPAWLSGTYWSVEAVAQGCRKNSSQLRVKAFKVRAVRKGVPRLSYSYTLFLLTFLCQLFLNQEKPLILSESSPPLCVEKVQMRHKWE